MTPCGARAWGFMPPCVREAGHAGDHEDGMGGFYRIEDASGAAPAAAPIRHPCERCATGSVADGCEKSVRHPDGRLETVCCECWNRSVYERRAARKAQLAAMERCEFCGRRATYTAGRAVAVCGVHLKAARRGQARQMAGLGNLAFLGLFGAAADGDEQIRQWARGGA